MPDQGRPGSLANRLAVSKRILAVEDEADIAEFLFAYFRASGYDLIHVDPASPYDVLDAIDEHKPDAILLDYRLRGFSGHEAYCLIRGQDRLAFVPVIVVTGDATARERSKEAVSALGLDGFVEKPFNVNTLAELVAERIDAARIMAKAGRDENLGVMTQAYLTARLSDEIIAAPDDHSVSFALVQLRTLGNINAAAGADGVTYVVRELIAIARRHLPTESVLGRTDANELAILVSGWRTGEIKQALTTALAAAPSTMSMPGGAKVKVELSAGLAGFPEHATSVDELYMAADAALADAMDAHATLRVAI